MKSLPLSSFRSLFLAVLIVTCGPLASQAESLLPAFGAEGRDFTVKARDGHIVKGWLPTAWTDNTDWAPVTATYTKLTDSPDSKVAAVRIAVEKVDDGGQLQMTTYGGLQKYKSGTRYAVSGWVRSASGASLMVGARQTEDPYEFYHEKTLSAGAEWKKFEFEFTPSTELTAHLMFIVRETGTVDLAGVTLEEKP